jgi:hypothetical protein
MRRRTLHKKRVLKKRQTHKKKARFFRKTYRKAYRKAYRGGNYHKDITTQEMEGVPIKNKDVIIASPLGVMSTKEYKSLMESIDRNGVE